MSDDLDILELRRRRDALPALASSSVRSEGFRTWHRETGDLLVRLYTDRSPNTVAFDEIRFWAAPEAAREEHERAYRDGLARARELLDSMLELASQRPPEVPRAGFLQRLAARLRGARSR